MIPVAKAPLLEGKQGLIVGIANEQSIAWGCAKAFRALGAKVAVTYLNEKAKKFVEPLARELEAPILMPLDVRIPGQMEAVFERIEKEWGRLDFLIHSIAFSPKDALGGRVVDVPQDGFLTTMDVWQPDGRGELQHHGRRQGGAGKRGPLHGCRTWSKGNSRARHFAGTACDACRLRDPRIR
jgi:enoyl-[acyl-carrier protein] reductase I